MKYLALYILFTINLSLYSDEKSIIHNGKLISFRIDFSEGSHNPNANNRIVNQCNLEKKECQEIGKLEQNMHSYQVIKLDEERIFVYGGSNIKTAVTYPEIYNLKTNTSKIINVSNPYVNNFNAKLFKLSDGNLMIYDGTISRVKYTPEIVIIK
jgi:hypothetical protein